MSGSKAPPSPFVGREAERAHLETWLERGEGAHLTVLGPPGIGKSRLVLEVLRELPLSVALVDLAGAAAEDVPHRFALALGCPRSSVGVLSRAARAIDVFVLDGAGRGEALSKLVAELSLAVPHLRWLATSRRPLGHEGETLFMLGGIGVPRASEPLDESPAGALYLLHRAIAGHPPHADAELPAVRRVLERVGDLPLAIELVVPQIAELGPETFVKRLDRPLDWLVDGDGSPLSDALRASFAELSPAARELLAELASLERPFDLDDADLLAGAPAAALLRQLRTSSWLVLESKGDARGTYDLLAPIRQFVLDAMPSARSPRSHRAILLGLTRGRPAPPSAIERAFAARDLEGVPVDQALEAAHSIFVAAGCGERFVRMAEALASAPQLEAMALSAVARMALELGRFELAEATLARLSGPDAATLRARLSFRTGRYEDLAIVVPGARPSRTEDVEVIATAAAIRGDRALGRAIYRRALGEHREPADRGVLHALLARYLAEGEEGDAALVEVEAAEALAGSDGRVAASLLVTRGLVAHDARAFHRAAEAYEGAIARYAGMGNPLAAYVRCALLVARLEAGLHDEARATALALVEDAPADMAQLAPFIELCRWLLHRSRPFEDATAATVVGASTALVRAFIARSDGRIDEASLAASLRDNEPHARWSTISRALGRLASDAPAAGGALDEPTLLLLEPHGRWFSVSGLRTVSLATRPILTRVLRHLAGVSENGGRADVDDIARVAWPGERMLESAKRSRVHVAVGTLRKLGLRDHLTHAPTGYRIELPIRWAAPS